MKNLSNLERRVAVLERSQNKSGTDPLVLAMEKLNDNELGLVEEYMSLLYSGFAPEDIETMMQSDSGRAAVDAIVKVDAEYKRLTEIERPRRQYEALKK